MLNVEKIFSEAERKDEVENFAHFEKDVKLQVLVSLNSRKY
jgi:hypothetical protein